MTFNNILTRLEKHGLFVDRLINFLGVFEAVLVLVIGILSNNLLKDDKSVHVKVLLALSLTSASYLFLLYQRTRYAATFPGSIINELRSERDLGELQRRAERQRTLDDFLISVIQRLNSQTCALNMGDDGTLCERGISAGIYSLMQPVVDNISFVLDTVKTDFTVSVYLDFYATLNPDQPEEKGIIVIADNLLKEHVLTKDLLSDLEVRGEQLALQTAIRESFRNVEFVKRDYSTQEGDFSIVCCPIPLACDEHDVSGVLVILSKAINGLPVDVAVNLTIFNSVISNWIYRYNECAHRRRIELAGEPEE